MPPQAPKHFTIVLKTKPYIKKYLQTLYGQQGKEQIILDPQDFFGIVIQACLCRSWKSTRSIEKLQMRTDKFTEDLKIMAPLTWLTEYKHGSDIAGEKQIAVNKLFETRFEEDLFRFCYMYSMIDIPLKDAYDDFCRHHNLEIDVDITFENIKKTEYRARKKFFENVPLPLSRPKNATQNVFF